MQRKIYTFDELKKEVEGLDKYYKSSISDSIEDVLKLIDAFALKNNLELFQILTPNNSEVKFIFNV